MNYENLNTEALDLLCPVRLGDDELGELKELKLSGEDIPDELITALIEGEELKWQKDFSHFSLFWPVICF